MAFNALFCAVAPPLVHAITAVSTQTGYQDDISSMPCTVMIDNSININILISPSLVSVWILNILYHVNCSLKNSSRKNLAKLYYLIDIYHSDDLKNPKYY